MKVEIEAAIQSFNSRLETYLHTRQKGELDLCKGGRSGKGRGVSLVG